jgi:hypothetical protein
MATKTKAGTKKRVLTKKASKKTPTKKAKRRVSYVIRVTQSALAGGKLRDRSYGTCQGWGCASVHPDHPGTHLTGCSKSLTDNTVRCWYEWD